MFPNAKILTATSLDRKTLSQFLNSVKRKQKLGGGGKLVIELKRIEILQVKDLYDFLFTYRPTKEK